MLRAVFSSTHRLPWKPENVVDRPRLTQRTVYDLVYCYNQVATIHHGLRTINRHHWLDRRWMASRWTRWYASSGLVLGLTCKRLASIVESIAIFGSSLFVPANLEIRILGEGVDCNRLYHSESSTLRTRLNASLFSSEIRSSGPFR